MPSLRDIRRKISSVKKTQQITRAMQMVSAAKLQRAQDRLLTSRPYSNKLAEVIGDLALRADPQKHPLLQRREGPNTLVLVITTDRGPVRRLQQQCAARSHEPSGPASRVADLVSGRWPERTRFLPTPSTVPGEEPARRCLRAAGVLRGRTGPRQGADRGVHGVGRDGRSRGPGRQYLRLGAAATDGDLYDVAHPIAAQPTRRSDLRLHL